MFMLLRNKQTNRQTDKQTNKQTNKRADRRTAATRAHRSQQVCGNKLRNTAACCARAARPKRAHSTRAALSLPAPLVDCFGASCGERRAASEPTADTVVANLWPRETLETSSRQDSRQPATTTARVAADFNLNFEAPPPPPTTTTTTTPAPQSGVAYRDPLLLQESQRRPAVGRYVYNK